MAALASDIGGTFTDVVLVADGRVHVAKTLTTPDDPTEGLLRGVRRVLADAGVTPASVDRFTHATTLATNVILERRGAAVAFVTTRGFRSMLVLGRQARVEEERYDLAFSPGEPPVPLTHTFEVPERLAADGTVLTPLDEAAARQVAERIAGLGVAAVAICLLHSHVDDAHERRLASLIAERLPDGTPVVISSEVWPELGEYERATTTLMSAYVGPVMAAYLRRLRDRLSELGITAPVHVMESAGGVLPAELAASRAVYTIESGPAAGVVAAAREGARRGLTDLISFDMGGTTAKAGLVRGGRPGVTHEFQVGGTGSFGGRRPGTGVPIKVPAIDLAEVGSGGGSIAWVESGALRVGPRSAGAAPGPACYGRGGTLPTVTDADLVLGYLDPEGLGDLRLRPDLAEEAIARHVAKPLGVEVVEAAAAIHDIAGAQMGTAVHVVTVRRGIDPRGFTLVALGGAAPTHAVGLADRFGIRRVLVPARCGVGSAAGLLHADLAIERSRTFLARTADADPAALEAVLADLETACRADLSGRGADGGADLGGRGAGGGADLGGRGAGGRADLGGREAGGRVVRSVGLRFTGQAHAFTVELLPGPVTRETVDAAVAEFYARYRESYGIDLRDPAELTVARARVSLPAGAADVRAADAPRAAPDRVRRVWFEGAFRDVPVRERAACAAGERFTGPCVITEPQSSLLVPPGWTGLVDEHGAVSVEKGDRR
ncbi:hydantoinase/oxoprolinase family protein [Actinoallomurus sp. CA-150999]|uniref:hydantoinase/oxoprolinase family protein n=1 Tax=Actinoallomurus sp. CA-150999 TaxID=3239887 RepID=UPI003D92BBEF